MHNALAHVSAPSTGLQNELARMDNLFELKEYQNHPKQMKAGARGKVGVLELVFEKKGQKSVLKHLYRVAPLLVQQALYWDESWPMLPIVPIISIGGGVLQGDRYFIDIQVNDHSVARVTTQSATRIQEMDANYATQYQKLTVGRHAYLEYVPDTTILYKNSRFACENKITVDETAVLIYGETVMLGRKHHLNERYQFDLFSSLVNIYRPCGRLVFSEKVLIKKTDMEKDLNAVMKGYDVFSNIICILPSHLIQSVVEAYPFKMDKELDLMSGVSLLPNDVGVVLRVVGKESYHVKSAIQNFTKVIKDVAKSKFI